MADDFGAMAADFELAMALGDPLAAAAIATLMLDAARDARQEAIALCAAAGMSWDDIAGVCRLAVNDAIGAVTGPEGPPGRRSQPEGDAAGIE